MDRDTYKKAYLMLFNQITDEIERLKEIQCRAEEIFMSSDEFDACPECNSSKEYAKKS
ncbi:MAG: hypothetical protein ACOX6P_08225 [Candidatus Merdivicinus sp.]|jgi:hypothetical protein